MADDHQSLEDIKHLWENNKELFSKGRANLRMLNACLINLIEQIEKNGDRDIHSEELRQIFGDKRSFVLDIDSTKNLLEELKIKLERLEYCQESMKMIRDQRGRRNPSKDNNVDSGITSASSQLLTCSIDSTVLDAVQYSCIQEETPHSSDNNDTSTNGTENEEINGTQM